MSVNNDQVLFEITNLSKSFEGTDVLKGISTTVKKGEVLAIIGPSGSGKSTFLRCLNLLEEPTGGEILFEGSKLNDPKSDINALRERIGMVFQQFNLFPHMSVKENIELAPMKVLGKSKEEASKKADELLKRIGLPDKADSYPNQLSGGEAQRVGIVRAIINDPTILFADEPTGQLNSASSKDVLDIFSDIHKNGQSIVMVTHDLKTALRATRVIFLRDGGIVGEYEMPVYGTDDIKQRRSNLQKFLDEMGW